MTDKEAILAQKIKFTTKHMFLCELDLISFQSINQGGEN